ncbi:MAG: hypothetical protein WCF84_07330 [Anaerolineae bacterium]
MPIVLFVIVFGLTLFLQRWLHQHIQGLTFAVTGDPGCAMRFLFILLLPGVILHEASHWVVANLLFVRTGKVNLGLSRARGKQFSLGSVTVERSDSFRESLIGVAPFFVGLGAIILIAGYGFDLWPNTTLSYKEMLDRVLSTANDWLTWVDLYLIFAVSTAMIPSESDREPWGQLLLIFGGIALIALFLGWSPRSISPDVINAGRAVLNGLTFAFGVSVVVNGAVAFFIWIVEWMVASITRRRVKY